MSRVLALRAILTTVAVLALPCTPALAAAPANDDFANAEAITGADATATGTTVEATKQTGEPNHANDSLGHSVWYRWEAPSDGTAVIDTIGSGFATTLGAYRGSAVQSVTQLAAMDAQIGERSRVSFTVKTGDVVYVAVDVDYGSPGAVKLNVAIKDSPPGDSFAAPETLTGSSDSETNDTTFATREAGEPWAGSAGASVWYSWTAPSDGPVAVSTAGSAFQTALAVYKGTTFDGLTRIAYNSYAQTGVNASRAGFEALAGETYLIQVDGYYGSSRGPLALALRHAASPPANDPFASPTLLPSERSVSVTGDSLGGTAEAGEPQHYPYMANRNSVWYSWTAPSSGSLTIKATPGEAGFTPILAAYTGDALVGLKRVANQAQDWSGGPQQIRIRVEAGTTYRIAMESYGVAGSFAFSLELIDSPANDDFANALPLTGLDADAAGSTVGATQEPCEPVHDDNYYDPSVWYTWTAPASGAVTIDTAGSSYATVLGIYTGGELCKLTRVAVNRLSGAGLPAKRSFRATAGVTYRIAVDGQNGRTGSYKLALRHTPPPANDLLANAQVLTGATLSVSGTLLGATGEAGEPNPGAENGATVWYSWTAPSSGPTTVKAPTFSFSGGLSVHTGTTMASLSLVKRTNYLYDGVSFRATAGTTYLFAVDGGTLPSQGDFKLDLKHTAAPNNDDFAAAIPILGSSATLTGSNVAATTEPGEPQLSYYGGGASVWYTWTAPADGGVAIDTAGSGFDTILGVYTGHAVNALTQVTVNNDVSYDVRTSRVAFRVTAGTTYRIVINGGYYYNTTGELKLKLTHRTPPGNDAFAMATPLPSAASVSIAGANLGATAETGEPQHYSYDSSKASVWYAWTAPSGGALTIKATSDFRPVLAAYTGTTITGLARVRNQAQDWNGGPEQIRIRVEAGTTYYIAVDALASLAGEFNLSLTLVPSPANDDFAKAEVISGLEVDVEASTVGATQEPCEPVHDDNYYDPSVWYTWTAPESGAVTLDTTGSDFPTVLGVYTGNELCSLSRVVLRRMNAPPVPAKRGFRAVAGKTYRIAVDGFNAKMGNFKLSLRHSPPPANDMFDKPQELSGDNVEVTGTNFGATAEPGEPGGIDGATVWYSWTATTTGAARVNLPTADFRASVNVYTGDSPGTLVRSNKSYYYDYSSVTFKGVAGTKYRIAVDGGWQAAQGDFTLRLVSLAAPANDDFEDSIEVTGATGTTDGNRAGATTEPNEPAPTDYWYSSEDRGTVWYSWTAPESTLVKFNTGYEYSAQVSAFTGDKIGELKRVPGAGTFRAEAGKTYRIMVSGYQTVDYAPFTLSWKSYPPPPNDAFADAIELTGSSASQAGTTVGASREAGEPASSWSYSGGGATVWYTWTATSDGLAGVRTTDNAVSVYTGDEVGSLTPVANSTAYYGGTVHFRAKAGTTYRIRVEGAELSTYGSFTLSLSTAASPANDDFENAVTLGTGTVSGTTTGATSQEGEPLRYSYSRGTVWYSWTPATTGTAVLTLPNSYYHGVSAYTGDSLATLEQRAANGSSYNPTRFHVKAGTTYRIAVDSEMTTYGRAFTLKAEVQPGPANDDFADAVELTGTADSETGSNVNATLEPGESGWYYSGGTGSIWYRWTAPTSGRVTVDLSGSSFDTTLGAYSGANPKTLKQLAYDHDSGDGSTSKVNVAVRAGTTYHFAVNGYYGQTGSVKVALSHSPAPANDDFSAAAEISAAPASISGDTSLATREPNEPRNDYYSYYYESHGSGGSLWYSWTPKVTGRATIDMTGSGFATAIGVYDGSAVGALTRVTSGYTGGSDTKVSFDAVKGKTYRISVDGYSGASGAFKLGLTQAEPPPNDDIANAEPLSGKTAVAAGTNVGATREDGEPANSWYSLNGSVWYRWTAPTTGTAVFSAQSSSFTPVLFAYPGSALPGAQAVATGSGSLRFYATAGTTYSISVAGTYSANAAFTLKLDLLEPPANDLFANATELAGTAVDASGSTVNATQEKCEPIHDDNYYDPSVWFSWKAPADGRVVIDTAGSSFSTVLGIYTGDFLCSLSRVTVERLSGAGEVAKRAFQAQAGVTYRIAVDGQGGRTGSYKLSLRQTVEVPTNTEPPPDPPGASSTGDAEERAEIVVPPQEVQQDASGSDPPPGEPVVDSNPPVDQEQQQQQQQQPPQPQNPPSQDPPAQDPPSGDAPSGDTPSGDAPSGDQQRQSPPTQGDQPPAPGGSGQPPPTVSPEAPPPLRMTASFQKQRLTDVLTKGLAGTASCSIACRIDVTVTVDPVAAKKLKLVASKTTTARASATANGAPAKLVVRMPKAALKKLRTMKSLPLTVRVVATRGAEQVEQTLRLTVKR
jgi:hypothetical protein